MTEAKLHQAIRSMPEPKTDFPVILEAAKRYEARRAPTARARRLAVTACAILVLLGVTFVGAATTQIHMSMWATTSYIPMKVEHNLGIQIPNALGESEYLKTTNLHTVPKGTTYLEALIDPSYRWYSIEYGERVQILEEQADHNGSRKITWETRNPYELNVGSTKNELWKYTFCFNDDGIWERSDILPESYRTEDYNGITVYSGTRVYYYDPEAGLDHTSVTSYYVVWVDEANQVLFSLRTEAYDTDSIVPPQELMEFARQIIDMNQDA